MWASAPFGEPSSRMRRVRRRVSTPAMPIRFCDFSHTSKPCAARQLDGPVTSARMTQPRAAGVRVSTSSGLAPTLPICGKVKVTTWPA
jgi:hypothetical protein